MFVAHRLRTIYDSDQILVLKDGHVVESGTHAQLLEIKGVYAELWHGECFFYRSPREDTKDMVAQELSLAQDTDLERNLEVGPDSELAENVIPTDVARPKK